MLFEQCIKKTKTFDQDDKGNFKIAMVDTSTR